MHFRRVKSRAGQSDFSARFGPYVTAMSLALVLAPSRALAERRSAIDLEPVTPYFSTGDYRRTQISVLAFTYGHAFNRVIPYFGGGVGFFTLQARGGVTWWLGDPDFPGPLIRLEARPQLLLNPCVEPLIVGSLGVGYRWPLERGDPGNPGTALYLLPAFTGGEGFLHENCGKDNQMPLSGVGLFGGTLSGGFDW